MELDISLFNWRALPESTKAKLAKAFAIPRQAPIHVSDGHIVDDGYRYEDLRVALTLEKLQAFAESSSNNFLELLDFSMAKINAESDNVESTNTSYPTQPTESVAPKRRGPKPGSKRKPKIS